MRIRDARFGIVNVSVPIQQPPKDPILPEDQAKAAAAVSSSRELVNVVTRGAREALERAAGSGRTPRVRCISPSKLRAVASEMGLRELIMGVVWPGRGQPFWDEKLVRNEVIFWGMACGFAGVTVNPKGTMGPEGSGFYRMLSDLSLKISPENQGKFVAYADALEVAAGWAQEIMKSPESGNAQRAWEDVAARLPCMDAELSTVTAEAEAKLAEGERQRAEEERKRQEVLLHNAEAEAYRKQAVVWAREYKVWLARKPTGGELAPALALAAAGFLVGGPVGAAAGGVVGLVAGGDKGAAPPAAPTPPSWMPFDVQAQILSEAQAAA